MCRRRAPQRKHRRAALAAAGPKHVWSRAQQRQPGVCGERLVDLALVRLIHGQRLLELVARGCPGRHACRHPQPQASLGQPHAARLCVVGRRIVEERVARRQSQAPQQQQVPVVGAPGDEALCSSQGQAWLCRRRVVA
jgi:hypothetical protein